MALQNFIDRQSPVVSAAWLNAVDRIKDTWLGTTAAETTAGVVPAAPWYPPGDLRRYGGVGDGSTADDTALASAALQAVQSQGSAIFVEGGSFRISANTTLAVGVCLLFGGQGSFALDVAKTLTINGQVIAFSNKIFTGSGAVVFGASSPQKAVYVEWFGAVAGGSSATNTTAIQAALDSSGWVTIYEAYTIDAALNLRSNQIVQFVGAGSLTLAGGVTTEYMLRGATVDNVRIVGGAVTGNGSAGLSSIYLTSCTNVLISDVSITKAGSMGVYVSGCSRVTVRSCNLSQNYFYGIEDRDGTGNSYFGNRCYQNGDTGVATSTGGRGINLWRCVGNYVAGNRFANNTEYGFRIYSEAADATTSYGNRIVDNQFEDNTSADMVLYDESLAGTLVKQNVIANNVAQRSTNPSLGVSFLLHGGDNTIENCHVFKSGAFGNFVAFNFYYAVRNIVRGCSATNTADALGFSNATDCIVEGFRGRTVATVAGVAGFVGSGNVLRDSEFVHGGGGVADVGVVHYNSTGRNFLDGVYLDGFPTGVYIGTESVSLRNVSTVNSTTAGLRKDSDAQVNQEILGCSWDSTNPTLIQYLERKVAGKATLYAAAAPTIRTWAVGDRCYNSAPSAGNPKSWVCTVAGTPGTWTSEGNL